MVTITQKHRAISPKLKAFIVDSIREILDDPDYGLELRPEFKKRLRAARRSRGRLIPMSEVKKKYL